MARIEGIRIQNYKALKDITLGGVTYGAKYTLTPMTVVIGKNGVGKSSIFDAFGFLADCMTTDIEAACNARNRGGFDKLVSSGVNEPISFEIYYREGQGQRPITYEVSIGKDQDSQDDRPIAISERLRQRGKNQKSGRPRSFLRLNKGKGHVWAGDESVDESVDESIDESVQGDEGSKKAVTLSPHTLGIVTLAEHVGDNPRIERFKSFIKKWYLSYFTPDSAREITQYGVDKHLNLKGDNMANVVRYLEKIHGEIFQKILDDISQKIPGIGKIEAHKESITNNMFLLFKDKGFSYPFTQQQMSDGTLKLFCYMLLLRNPEAAPFICIEEPENGLYHQLLEFLAEEFREHASRKHGASQVFVTTHQPYFVDAFSPDEVWVLEKGEKGFAKITRSDEFRFVKNMKEEGLSLGSLWHSGYLEEG